MTTTAHPEQERPMSVTGKPIVYGMSHPKPNPKTDAIVAEVRQHAAANHDNGWAIVADTWTDADIAEAIGWAESLAGAVKKIRKLGMGIISPDTHKAAAPKPAPATKLATVTPIAGKATRDPATGIVYANQVEDDEDVPLNSAPERPACTDIDFAAHWAAIQAN